MVHPSPPVGYSSLRKGRVSLPGQAYLLTWRTFGGKPILDNLTASRQMVRCLRFADRSGWARTFAFVIMPDHIHWCVELGLPKTLERLVFSIKSYSSTCLVNHDFREGPLWQEGFHDRAIRASEDLVAVSRYIVANPVRAGMVEEIGDYPHWDAVWLD